MPAGMSFDSLAEDLIGEELERIEQQMRRTSDAADDLGESYERAGQSGRSAASNSRDYSESLEEIRVEVARLRDTINAGNESLDGMANLMKSSTKYAQQLTDALSNMSSATGRGRSGVVNMTKDIDKLSEIYRKLGVNITSVSQKTTLAAISEKEYNDVLRTSEDMATRISGSYAELSDKYKLLKIYINQLTIAERENTEEGKALVAKAREIYEQMNVLQQKTGKYTLQVGDYSKAMTGLNIATTQVVRELPTLANSLSQFVIAISNNIPIWIDNIGAVKRSNESLLAYKKTLLESGDAAKIAEAQTIKVTSAFKGVVKSVFSWQTAIVLLLTVLPKLIKGIQDKKKATEEANGAVEETIKYEKAVADAYSASSKEGAKNVARLKTLYNATQDELLSLKQRHYAAEVLKKDYKEAFKNYTEEEILLGKAATAYDKLAESLEKNARAKAYLNQITELYEKRVGREIKSTNLLNEITDLEKEFNTQREEYAELVTKGAQGYLALAGMEPQGYLTLSAMASKKIEEKKAEREALLNEMEDIDKAISYISRQISYDSIYVGKEDDATKKEKESKKDLQSYYFDWRESVTSIMEDGYEKELQALNDKYDKEKATWAERLRDIEVNHADEVAERLRVVEILTNIEVNRVKEMVALTKDYFSTEVEEEENLGEESLAISDVYNAKLAENARKQLDTRAKINEYLVEGNDNEAKKEAATFKELVKEKLALERDLQIELLKMRHESGRLSEDELKIELAKVEQTYSSSIAKLGSRSGRRTIWDILFGDERVVDEKGNFIKKLNAEAAQGFSQMESVFKSAMSYANEWIDKLGEIAEAAVESAKIQVDAAKEQLDYEKEARANGYANNVELAQREYDEKLALQEKAEAEAEKYQKAQEAIDTATQVSSLITATANIIKVWSSLPGVGQVLSAAAISAMFAAFIGAKAAARSATKYGEGMSEYLDYGGSHASGNDIDFGTTKDGTHRRVERGEMIGVINKRNVKKYGVGEIANIISSLNHGDFENKYGLAFAGAALSQGSSADLTSLEHGVDALVEQGNRRIVVSNGKTIEYYKNTKRIIRS